MLNRVRAIGTSLLSVVPCFLAMCPNGFLQGEPTGLNIFLVNTSLYADFVLERFLSVFQSFREIEVRYITSICRSLFLSNVPQGAPTR